MSITRMSELDLRGKRVLIREDLNVPIARRAASPRPSAWKPPCPTSRAARDAGARVMVLSHLGRPKEGTFDEPPRWRRWPTGWARHWARRCAW